MHSLQVKLEVPIARCDCAFGHDNDFRNVDSALDVEVNRLRHHFRNIHLFRHPCKLPLHRGNRQLNSFYEPFESIGGFQSARTGEPFELLDDLQSRFCDGLLSFRVEKRLLFRQGSISSDPADNHRGHLDHLHLTVGNITPDHDASSYDRVRFVRLINNFLKMVMGDNSESIYSNNADSLAIGQPQSSTD